MTVYASRSCLGLGTCVGSTTRQIVVARVLLTATVPPALPDIRDTIPQDPSPIHEARHRPIRCNPRYLHTVRRVDPSSGGHLVFCNGAFGVKSLANASRRRARSSVRGRRDAATSCDQADRV